MGRSCTIPLYSYFTEMPKLAYRGHTHCIATLLKCPSLLTENTPKDDLEMGHAAILADI